ncbi:MAG: GNAT family N-acetyltransferase [Bacteroidales bacterium]|nr:GNAT family N-acetyltransferase [Bacteroidales bacterium]
MINFFLVQKSDIPIIQGLARQIWFEYYPSIISEEQIEYMLDKMYSSNVIEQELEKGFRWYFISLDEDKIIGFLSYNLEKDEQKVKLNKLYILTAYHGKGFGQLALDFVISQAKNLNAKWVYLTVNKNNQQAIKAYVKAGFYIQRSEKFDIGNGFFMDDYIMVHEL